MVSKIILRFALLIAIACSVLSQLPMLLDTTIGDVMKMVWILPFVCILIINPTQLLAPVLRPFYIFFIVLLWYLLMANSLTGFEYFGSDFKNIIISMAVFAVSYAAWYLCGNQTFFNAIAIGCLISSVIVGFFIYRDFLAMSSIAELQYAYNSKNSAAQILLNSIILLYGLQTKRKWFIGVIILMIAILTVEIFLLKSRATMVCYLFVVLFFGFTTTNKHIKNCIWAIAALGVLYFIYDSTYFEQLYSNIILANREVDDINSVSSGRMGLIENVLKAFKTSPVFGVGNLYLDCFPIAILAQYGIIGAVIVFTFLIKMYRKVLMYERSQKRLDIVAFLLFTTILINSLFEAQPPFGPGMKCFIIWMAIGFSFAENKRISEISSDNRLS